MGWIGILLRVWYDLLLIKLQAWVKKKTRKQNKTPPSLYEAVSTYDASLTLVSCSLHEVSYSVTVSAHCPLGSPWDSIFLTCEGNESSHID